MKILRSKKLIGLVFLALIAGGVWLTNALFTKNFTDYDKVTMESSGCSFRPVPTSRFAVSWSARCSTPTLTPRVLC